jgi:cytochrome b561
MSHCSAERKGGVFPEGTKYDGGIPLSSAFGGAALAARVPDHRVDEHRIFLAACHVQLRPQEAQHSHVAHGGWDADLGTIIRLVVRVCTRRPAELATGYPVLDALVPIFHYSFYVLVVLMVATGYTTAILAGLNKIVFMSSGDPLPADLTVYPTFVAHALLGIAFASLIILHVLAALYHQFIRKDGPFRRVSFGQRA